jgi:hypothetical protein
MTSPTIGSRSPFVLLALILLLASLWLGMHGYHGLTGDGQIYAFQAFARLHPQLATDLYLQNTSQDQFTLFSPLYAWCIGLLGLEGAARLLTLVFTLWFVTAAWSLARVVTSRDAAWLAAGLLLIVAGDYGASGVFQVLDPFLTARLPAEAMVVTALSCHYHGLKRLGLFLALAALPIHPLMALPGVFVLVGLGLPLRANVICAIGGVFAILIIAVLATNLPGTLHVLTLMDPAWLHVVRERSEFLFLQLWRPRDWSINAQPFMYLAFTAVTTLDERIRKLCAVAALVGGAGLAVAFIAGQIGPVASLVQGQGWRWVWIGAFISVMLMPSATLNVWRDERCGTPCATLLVYGWTLPGAGGTVCAALALMLWLNRVRINARLARYLRSLSVALGIGIAAWSLTSLDVAKLQGAFALKFPAVVLGAIIWWGITASRTARTKLLISAMLAVFSILIFPTAFTQAHTMAAPADIHEFEDWDGAIPSTSTVLIAPPRDVGAFVWFTLARPNYLSLDQSAGVIFSRATALEVQRRSTVLLPIMDPEWNIWTKRRLKSAGAHPKAAPTRVLTAESLRQVCADPELGFVVSRKDVGFAPLRHEHPGMWQGWNLYDCRNVRSGQPAT